MFVNVSDLKKFLIFVSLFLLISERFCFKISEVDFSLERDGFTLSIADEDGIKNVAYQVNRNRPFYSFTEGELSEQTLMPENGRWAAKFNKILKSNDVLFVWVNVQHGSVVFRRILNNPIYVSNYLSNPSGVSVTETPIAPKKNANGECEQSITETSLGRRVCKNDLIFEDDFNKFDYRKWEHVVRLPLDISDYEFVTYFGKAETPNGKLDLRPSIWREENLRPFINGTFFDISPYCAHVQISVNECFVRFSSKYPVSPIIVPRINTKNSFSFKYGKVEIKAKFPVGDWIIPLMLLEPKDNYYGSKPYESGQLRVAFARGNRVPLSYNGRKIDGSDLFGGALLSTEPHQRLSSLVSLKKDKHFGDEFHVYTMTWLNDKITFEVDGENYGTVEGPFINPTTKRSYMSKEFGLAPFNQMFYLTLGVSVGGFGDFPDDDERKTLWEYQGPTAKKAFLNQKHTWLPTWTSPSLEIDYVRVYAV